MSNLLLGILGSIAEFERELIAERRSSGIERAKKQGKYTGRKPVLDYSQISELKQMVRNGDMKSKIARHYGISRESVYRYLRKDEINRS